MAFAKINTRNVIKLHALAVYVIFCINDVACFTSPKQSGKASIITCTSQNTQLGMGISKWNENYLSADDDEDDGLVTKEMFLRGMLEEPRRKKKGSKEYKPHDNRDALPFVVKVKTPDPYTPPGKMLHEAKKNTELARKKDGKALRKSNLVGMDGKYSNAVAASIFARNKSGSLDKILGEFQLEKNTNCGDLIEVGDREFEVVTARSQMK